VGQGRITVFMSVSIDWGNTIEVFQGSERENTDVRAVVQIPDPFECSAYNYDAVESMLS